MKLICLVIRLCDHDSGRIVALWLAFGLFGFYWI